MNIPLRPALGIAAAAGGVLLSIGCVASSAPASPGSDNSGFDLPQDGAGGSVPEASDVSADSGTSFVDSGSSAPDGASPVQVDQALSARIPVSAISPGSLDAAVAANNAFAVDLYERLDTDAGTTNLLTSPISASLALTMAYAGAQGPTATEMATALQFDPDAGSIFDGQNALTQALASRGAAALAVATQTATQGELPAPSASDYELQVVNSVWGEQCSPGLRRF